jgi:PAS domain S-box-containing protein
MAEEKIYDSIPLDVVSDMIQEPLLILDTGLHIKAANSAFCHLFHLSEATIIGQLIYALDNLPWNQSQLQRLLEEKLLTSSQVDHYGLDVEWEEDVSSALHVKARRAGNPPLLLLTFLHVPDEFKSQMDAFERMLSSILENPQAERRDFQPLLDEVDDTKRLDTIERQAETQQMLLAEVRAAHAEAEHERKRLYNLFMKVPAAVCVLQGPNHVYQLANPAHQRLVQDDNLIGRPICDIHSSLREKGYLAQLDRVYQTGESLSGKEAPVTIYSEDGKAIKEIFVNFLLHPIADATGTVTGIFVHAVDVTDHVSARRQIEELATDRERNLAQLRAIYKSVTEGLVIADPRGVILDMNPAALTLHGFETRAEAVNLHVSDYMALFDLYTIKGELIPLEAWPLSRALRTETFRSYEVRVKRKDTEGEWIASYSGSPVYDREGNFIFVVLIIRDVTEAKEAEQALLESEVRFRGTFENAAVGISHVAITGNWLRVNQRLCEILGYSEEELLSDMTFQDTTYPDDLAADLESLDRLIQGEIQEYQMEKRYFHKDGHIVWGQLTVALQRDENGEPLYCITVIEDITNRKQIEDALSQSETRFRIMAETLPDILFTCLPDGSIDYINSRFGDYTGTDPKEALGVRWTSFVHREDIVHYRQEWQQSLLQGLAFENEFRMHTAGGEYRWFVGRAHPIHNDWGEVERWVGTCTDIQDQKLTEEALRQSEHQLRTFNETLEERVQKRTRQVRELASALTLAEQRERRRVSQILHDHVQQMLYGIQMRNHLLKLDAESADLTAIKEHVRVMDELVGQAIRATRSLAVEMSPPVLKNEGLAAAIEWLSANMSEIHGLTVETDLRSDYQPASEDLRVLVFQVTRELLFNVVKHADTNVARLEIYEENDNVFVRVIDEGSGFDVTTIDQKDSQQERRLEGGFGLYSIQERLALFGGHLVVESTIDKGTTATIIVPCQPMMPS